MALAISLKLIAIVVILALVMVSQNSYANTILVNGTNVNATIHTLEKASLDWQFDNWNATTCDFNNISYNQGLGTEQNSLIAINSTGSGELPVLGWRITEINMVATCDQVRQQFGPFDVVISNPNNLNGTTEEPVPAPLLQLDRTFWVLPSVAVALAAVAIGWMQFRKK